MVMGMQPHVPSTGPSTGPAPWWAPQPEGPEFAKRHRLANPADPAKPQVAPSLQDFVGIPNATMLISVVVRAAGCTLQVPLDDGDLVLQVSLQGHTLILIPQGLVVCH